MGHFENAHEGTLFLDEIGELDLEMQAKLLRVLETNTTKRVGGSKDIPVNIRIIAATNKDLFALCQQGLFREDLYYRLHVIQIKVPPLRDRLDDIPELAYFFLQSLKKTKPRYISLEAMEVLKRHPWKGNIREFKNVIMRSTLFCDDLILDCHHLKFHDYSTSTPLDPQLLTSKEKQHIEKILLVHNGNRSTSAKALGITKTTLYRKIKEYNIQA